MRETDANTRAVSIIGETMLMQHPFQPTYFELAAIAVRSLAEAGFEIVPTVQDEPLYEQNEIRLSVGPGETPLPSMPAGSAARVGEARRTGDWSGVSDADWTAWVNVLRRDDPAAAAEFLPTYETLARLHGLYVRGDGTVTPLDKAAVDAGVIGIIERDIKPAAVTLEPGRIEEPLAGAKASTPESETGYAEAVRLIREGRAWPGAITRALGGASADGPEGNVWTLYNERMRTMGSDAEPDDEEPEKDTWGVRACLADDMAERHGCRVELSGIDDPHMPLTYVDDLTAYAVVTERVSGRLVGIVECWQSEDGDFIVPRTWLEITLSAWVTKSTAMRAA